MRLKASLVAVLLALSVGLVACGGSSDSSTGSSGATEAETEAPAEPEAGGEEAAEEEAAEAEAGGTGGAEAKSEPAPSGQARKAEKVEIVEFTYSPDPVVVQVGGKVTWKNEDNPPHTATADDGSFETGIIETGKQKSVTFKEAGTFTYYCKVHPFMHGTVEVVEKE
jgi:plastocyanin